MGEVIPVFSMKVDSVAPEECLNKESRLIYHNIDLPITFLGQRIKLSTMSSYDSVPVSDSVEFINNINMAKNYVESNKKIQEAIQKVKDFLK